MLVCLCSTTLNCTRVKLRCDTPLSHNSLHNFPTTFRDKWELCYWYYNKPSTIQQLGCSHMWVHILTFTSQKYLYIQKITWLHIYHHLSTKCNYRSLLLQILSASTAVTDLACCILVALFKLISFLVGCSLSICENISPIKYRFMFDTPKSELDLLNIPNDLT